MKAPRPFASPNAQIPGTFVRSSSLTVMKPRSSVATPAASSPRSSVLGVRPVASRRCEPRHLLALPSQSLPTRTPSLSRAALRHFELSLNSIPSRSRIACTSRRHVLIFAGDQTRPHLDHCDPAAEAAVHLRELESDVASADDDEMLRQEIDVHHARVVEVFDFVQALDAPRGRTCSDIEEDLRSLERVAVYAHAPRAFESRVSLDDGQVRRLPAIC